MNIETLLEKIDKFLNKQAMYEFAIPMKSLKAKIEEKTPKIFEHFYKIIGFGEEYPNTAHHWAAELGGFLKICNMKVKTNNKPLSAKQIAEIMLSVYSDVKEFSSIGGDLFSEYGYSKYKDSQIYNKLKQVLIKVIEYIQNLEEDTRVNPNEIIKIIGTKIS